MVCTCRAQDASIEQMRLFATNGVDHLERERHVRALIAEHPVGAGGQSGSSPRERRKYT